MNIYNENSIPDFYKKYDKLDPRFLCEFYGIKPRNISESKLCSFVKNKYEQTCIKKYGKPNALCKGTKPFKKRNKTVKKMWGVDNVFQAQEIIDKINSDELCIKRHGCTRKEFISSKSKEMWKNYTSEEKEEHLNKSLWSCNSTINLNKRTFNTSNLELKVQSYFEQLKIVTIKQYKINVNSNKNKFYDLFIKEKNLLIEINGDYWHANPKKFNENDLIKYPGKIIKAKEKWIEDEEKKKIAIQNGYRIIYFWEDELKEIKSVDEFLILYQNKLNECI